jgi:hopanoid biosynthesis associated protein HpnK
LKGLIITADDFGAAPEVNDAVETAHRSGVLTAASLMVAGPAAADAVARAQRLPSLRVGLHLVLVEGRPVLPAAAVSRLVDGHGALRTDMAALGAAVAFSRRTRRQLEAEISAQFEAFCATGLALDHCNAHKHFQLHPVIGSLIARIGPRFGLRAARVPFEPAPVLRAIEPETAAAPESLMAPLAGLLRRRLRAAGLLVPDRVFGLRWSGRMTRSRLVSLIGRLPEGLTEIYLHPATASFPGAAAGYRYRDELNALTSEPVRAVTLADGLRLGGFSDFLAPQPGPSGATSRALSNGSLMQ